MPEAAGGGSAGRAGPSPAWALLPGLGHMMLGHWSWGLHLAGATLLMAGVIAGSWDRFLTAWAGRVAEERTAAVGLVALLIGVVTTSVWDFRRAVRRLGAPDPPKSPWRVAARRFRANTLAVASVYVIALFYFVALVAPLVAPYDPAAMAEGGTARYLGPSAAHLFGTDAFGRDLFSRALYGARVSLSVGLLAMLVAKVIGTVYGAVSGWAGGWIDNVMMRAVDVVIAFPTFYLMLMLVGIFEADVLLLVLILGLTSWPGTARFIRGEILSLKAQEFTEAARAIGLPPRLILIRHLVPSALSPVLVSAALSVAGMIGAEAGLSFLGLGIRPPTPSWGNMVSAGQDALLVAWWVAFFPGVLLAVTLVAFSLLADGLRDALDPRVLMRRYL